VIAAALGASMVLAPAVLVLPFVATAALIASALMAVHAWRRAEVADPDRVGLWDLSGAWALIGISAAEFGDAAYLLTVFAASAR
jgi:hypothetical protein